MKINCHNFIFGQERLTKRRDQSAFTLIEVLIALSIFALIITCLLYTSDAADE